MASTYSFCEDNGASIGVMPRGTTRTTGISNVNLKAIDDTSSTYSSYSITGGTNSYAKYPFFVWSGTFNTISNVFWNHTGGNFGAGLTLKCGVSGSGFYATPTQTAVALFGYDLTTTGALSTGKLVLVGTQGPELSGKNTSCTINPTYSEYLGMQLQTTAAAVAGDTVTYVMGLQWQES